MENKRWSEEDLKILTENYDKVELEELCLRIGKSAAAVRWKASQLKLTLPRIDWTKEEDTFLLSNSKKMSDQEIADHLGRTRASVTKRFFKIRPRKLAVFRKKIAKIEDDVPFDNNLADGYRESMKSMKTGQSFVFPKGHYQIIVNQFVFMKPKRFATKAVDDDNQRIWRIS